MQQISPEDKSLLTKYTQVAKKIIYEPNRMQTFLKMLGSKEGAVTAVNTVVAAIEKLKPIPDNIRAFLGINVYVIMVDVAQAATGGKPDPKIMQEVIANLVKDSQAPAAPPAPEQPPAPAPDQGMLAQMQGAPAEQPPMPPEQPEEPAGGMLANMQRRGVPA